jgi:hypothetical protein
MRALKACGRRGQDRVGGVDGGCVRTAYHRSSGGRFDLDWVVLAQVTIIDPRTGLVGGSFASDAIVVVSGSGAGHAPGGGDDGEDARPCGARVAWTGPERGSDLVSVRHY